MKDNCPQDPYKTLINTFHKLWRILLKIKARIPMTNSIFQLKRCRLEEEKGKTQGQSDGGEAS